MNDFLLALVIALSVAMAWVTNSADAFLPDYLKHAPTMGDMQQGVIKRIDGTTLCGYSGITCNWDVFAKGAAVVVDLKHNKLSTGESSILSSAVTLRVVSLAAYQLGTIGANTEIIPTLAKTSVGFIITLTLKEAK